MQLERRTGHRITVASAVTVRHAARGDGGPSRHAFLARGRSAAPPPIDEEVRSLVDVAWHLLRAQESSELGELGLPDPESIELGGASHEYRFGIAGEGEPAVVAEHRDAVDESEERVEAVLDHEERSLAPKGERGERGDDLARADRIQIRRRLVEHERSRPHGQKRGEGHALLRPAGEGIKPSRCRGPEAGGRASFHDALGHLVPR